MMAGSCAQRLSWLGEWSGDCDRHLPRSSEGWYGQQRWAPGQGLELPHWCLIWSWAGRKPSFSTGDILCQRWNLCPRDQRCSSQRQDGVRGSQARGGYKNYHRDPAWRPECGKQEAQGKTPRTGYSCVARSLTGNLDKQGQVGDPRQGAWQALVSFFWG